MLVHSRVGDVCRWFLVAVVWIAFAAPDAHAKRVLVDKTTTIRTDDGMTFRYVPRAEAAKHHILASPFRCRKYCPSGPSLLPEIQKATKTDGGLGATMVLEEHSVIGFRYWSDALAGEQVHRLFFTKGFANSYDACPADYYGYPSGIPFDYTIYCFSPGYIDAWYGYPHPGAPGRWRFEFIAGDSASEQPIQTVRFDMLPATIHAVSGDGQTGVVGQALLAPVVAQLRDVDGEPVAFPLDGETTSFTLTLESPGGSSGARAEFIGPSYPHVDGKASIRWVLGSKAGTYRLKVKHPDAGTPELVFTATAVERRPPDDEKDEEEENGDEKKDDCLAAAGDPISIGSGNVYSTETDYARTGSSPLEFVRTYNSFGSRSRLTGTYWQTTFDRFVIPANGSDPLRVRRPDGRTIRFSTTPTGYAAQPHFRVTLEAAPSGWILTTPEGVEEFDATGRLTRITDLQGRTLTPQYASNGRMSSVATNTGETLTFAYDSYGQLSKVTDHAARSWTYTYSGWANLVRVGRPDGLHEHYKYEDGVSPYRLTSRWLSDSATYIGYQASTVWEYDAAGRGIASYVPHGGLQIARYDIAYGAGGARTVIDSLGNMTAYDIANANAKTFVRSVRGPEYATCNLGDAEREFDANMNIVATTTFGRRTELGAHNAKRQPAFRIDAAGTTNARRTDYSYDPRFHDRVTQITTPSAVSGAQRVASIDYNAQGNPTRVAVSGRSPLGAPVSRVTMLEYNGPLAQLTRRDGPRTDVADAVTMTYDATTKRLKSVTHANGIVLRSNIVWSKTGKILSEDRPNGLRLVYTYYPGNDRLQQLAETAGGRTRTTRWTYSLEGNVASIKFNDGVNTEQSVGFGYDPANRLTSVNFDGGYMVFTLDAHGNRKRETISGNGLKRWVDRTFDRYHRVDKLIQANSTVDVNVRPDGTVESLFDGRNNKTQYEYDDFKRLARVLEPGAVETRIGYDAADRITEVVDGNSARTGYEYDDLGNLVRLTSPDTGTTQMSYDAAGNRTRTIDANGRTTTFTYDGMNRLTRIDREGTDADETWAYDGCANGVGRLCSITITNGETQTFEYDGFGHVIGVTSDGMRVGYDYDAADNVVRIEYPSGRFVSYTYNGAGRVTAVHATEGGVKRVLADQITYLPMGPATSWRMGNGRVHTRTFDQQYWLRSGATPGGYGATYSLHDGNGNFGRIVSQGVTTNYGYDVADRLASAAADGGQSLIWQYDPVGNRTTQTLDGTVGSYAYEAMSNRIDTSPTADYTLDPSGSVTARVAGDGTGHRYEYGPDGRLTRVRDAATSGLIATYRYNGLGQRTRKTIGTATTRYAYGLSYMLLAETDATGAIVEEYVYLNGAPLALLGRPTVAGAPQTFDVTLDNHEPTGDFVSKKDRTAVGGSYLLLSASGAGTTYDYEYWDFQVPVNGAYDAFVWWMQAPGTGAATYHYSVAGNPVALATGALTKGTWAKLGTFSLQAGTRRISFQEQTGPAQGYSIDAVRLVLTATETTPVRYHFVDVDHLGAPRTVLDHAGTAVWRAAYDPFGAAAVVGDADGDGNQFSLNLRFPGQYYDEESSLHYNYLRDYDPSTGRYIESDPIGLRGGANTYAYAGANPLLRIDPSGRSWCDVMAALDELQASSASTDPEFNIPFPDDIAFADLNPDRSLNEMTRADTTKPGMQVRLDNVTYEGQLDERMSFELLRTIAHESMHRAEDLSSRDPSYKPWHDYIYQRAEDYAGQLNADFQRRRQECDCGK